VLAFDYPFLDIVWTLLIFFCWVIWLWLLVTVFIDVFRRQDIRGFTKALWIVFVIVLPFLGVFVYLLDNHAGMVDRSTKQRWDATGRSKRDAAAQIAKARSLLDSGAITQAEFDTLTRALVWEPGPRRPQLAAC
jgi:hypothetical protein